MSITDGCTKNTCGVTRHVGLKPDLRKILISILLRIRIAHILLVRTLSGRYDVLCQLKKEAAMSTLSLPKTVRIDVRASAPVKQLLQEAARSCHKNVSEFLLDAGINAANQALADRRHFVLNDEQWVVFQKALDRPVLAKPRLKKLLSKPGVLG